jgi:arylsulfatase A-like enzyme
LLHNIGYEKVYAVEDYDLEHNPDEQWKKDHKVDAFSIYTDDVFIKPMMNWIDNNAQRDSSSNSIVTKKPFFMTFLTSITHWPYGLPPKGADWNNTSYTARPAFNEMLNGIAYTDRFLSMVFDEFEERGLMNSTLFVIAGDHGVNYKHRRNQISTLQQEGEEIFDVAVTFHSKNKEIAKRINTVKSSVSPGVGKSPSSRSSIDIMPTILDFLNVFGKNETSSLDILNGTNTHSVVDGRSMLRPDSNNRLTLSICNPGDKMILRDRSYALVIGNSWQRRMRFIAKVWDLSKDPQQQIDTLIDREILSKFKKNKLKDFTGDQKDLLHWGTQAYKFVERVETDLVEAHESGHRCTNCTLFLLNSLETLDQWVEFETLDVSA